MPTTKLWERGEHTAGKHLILAEYLRGWLPVLGSWNGRILFLDGFAGPGEYAGGEEGSPIIALKAFTEHAHRHVIRGEVVFSFIEADEDRSAHLARLIDELRPSLPANATVEVVTGKFDESMRQVLDSLDEQKKKLAPAFVMVDPFGVSETPMSVISRILSNPRSEVYISFMYESINRFLGTPEFERHLDELFGTSEWRTALELTGEARKRFLYDVYARQLKNAGARHVVHVDLYRGKRLVYAIFFGTQHTLGCDLMKKAIWKAAPDGDFAFRGSRDGQLLLGVEQPDMAPLKEQLVDEFAGRDWVAIEDVIEFVRGDQVEYHTGHLKTLALRPMEDAGTLEVDPESRKRRRTYPDGCRLRFHS